MPSRVRRWVHSLVNRVSQEADPEPSSLPRPGGAGPLLTVHRDNVALASAFASPGEPVLDPAADPGAAFSALLRAQSVAAIDKVLGDYPVLRTAALDAYLAARLADLWREYKVVEGRRFTALTEDRRDEAASLTAELKRLGLAMGELLAGRRLLERVAQGDYAAMVTDRQWPPAGDNPMGPLTKESERATLDERVEAARYALSLTRRESEPELWATLQREVGEALLQCETTDRRAKLQEAERCFEAAREVWEGQAPCDQRRVAGLLYVQGAACRRAAQTLPQSEGGTSEARTVAQRAVSLYHAAQVIYDCLGLRLQSALMEHELGAAWLAMPGERGAAYLDRAIRHYRQARQIRAQLNRWASWAETTSDLANALTERWRVVGDAAALEEAIALAREVIDKPALAGEPRQLSRAFITLGNAYQCRLTSSHTDNYRDAITHYTRAASLLMDEDNAGRWDRAAATLDGKALDDLSSRPELRLPWAEALYNLAAVYLHYREGQPAANVEWARALYNRALEVYTREAYPLDWARIHISLSLAGYNLALLERGVVSEAGFMGLRQGASGRGLGGAQRQQRTRTAENYLRSAIEAGRQALTVLTPDLSPELWAMAHNNLGNAYADESENRVMHQQKAIECYEEALRVCSPASLPNLWAVIQNNLGVTYQEQALEYGGPGVDKAVRLLRDALKVQTPQTFPHDARRTARNLGHLLFTRRDWAGAERAFATAIEATETLYRASVGQASHQGEMAEAQGLYTHRAYALARLGRLEEAVVTWEGGKARLLRERLALDRALLEQAPADLRARFVAERERIKKLEAEQPETVLPTLRPITDAGSAAAVQSEQLSDARLRLNQTIAAIQQAQPGFMPRSDLTAIRAAARPDRPLVYLGTTGQGSLALIVPSADAPSTKVQPVWCDGFTQTDLEALLLTPRADAESHSFLYTQTGGGFQDPDHNYMHEHLPPVVNTLGKHLMGALARTLEDQHINSITLIPSGRLTLLPLHAARLKQGYFCQQTCVALAPAALTLTPASTRPAPPAKDTHQFFAVANPLPIKGEKPLLWAEPEVRAIEGVFRPAEPPVLAEYTATYPAVVEALNELAERPCILHFACHGQFNTDQPLDSGLVMAHREFLTLRDLYSLPRLKARLAVLSACQSAITDYRRVPDEAVGLPAGFLSLGVPGVVGSLWQVPDDSTALLMVKFYENLARPGGCDPAQALQDAQKWFCTADAPRIRTAMVNAGLQSSTESGGQASLAAPEHWAAFVYYGV